MNHYKGWVPGDPTPMAQELSNNGFKSVSIDKIENPDEYTWKVGFSGNWKPIGIPDRSIPKNAELFLLASTVLFGLEGIGELPARCNGTDCHHRFGGSLFEKRITLLVQEGDGEPARPQTYCFECFQKHYLLRPPEEETRPDRLWRLHCDGLNQTEIARELGISQSTVSNDLKKIAERRKPRKEAVN
jgi:hypothetical protein